MLEAHFGNDKKSISNSLDDSAYLDALKGNTDLDGTSANNLTIRANNRDYYSEGIQSVIAHQYETKRASHEVEYGIRYHYDEEEKNSAPIPIVEGSSESSDRKLITQNKTKGQPKRNISIPAKTDRFTIQVVSKKMLKDAEIYAAKLISKGYDAYIQRVIFKDNDEIFYRVRIGSYDNYNSAQAVADIVSKDIKLSVWVDFVRLDK